MVKPDAHLERNTESVLQFHYSEFFGETIATQGHSGEALELVIRQRENGDCG